MFTASKLRSFFHKTSIHFVHLAFLVAVDVVVVEHFPVVERVVIRVIPHHLPKLCHFIVKFGLTPFCRYRVLTDFALKGFFYLGVKGHNTLFKVNPILCIALLVYIIVDGVVVVAKRFLESRTDELLKSATYGHGVLALSRIPSFCLSRRWLGWCLRWLGRCLRWLGRCLYRVTKL